jgi:hypothetical protein
MSSREDREYEARVERGIAAEQARLRRLGPEFEPLGGWGFPTDDEEMTAEIERELEEQAHYDRLAEEWEARQGAREEDPEAGLR